MSVRHGRPDLILVMLRGKSGQATTRCGLLCTMFCLTAHVTLSLIHEDAFTLTKYSIYLGRNLLPFWEIWWNKKSVTEISYRNNVHITYIFHQVCQQKFYNKCVEVSTIWLVCLRLLNRNISRWACTCARLHQFKNEGSFQVRQHECPSYWSSQSQCGSNLKGRVDAGFIAPI